MYQQRRMEGFGSQRRQATIRGSVVNPPIDILDQIVQEEMEEALQEDDNQEDLFEMNLEILAS